MAVLGCLFRNGDLDRRRAGRPRARPAAEHDPHGQRPRGGRLRRHAGPTRPTAARSWSCSPSRAARRSWPTAPAATPGWPGASASSPPRSAPLLRAAPLLDPRHRRLTATHDRLKADLEPHVPRPPQPQLPALRAGSLVSNTGTWMQRVAQDWLVLRLTDGSGAALGITTGLQFLPVLLLSPYAGVIADRFPKRRLLQLTQLTMAAGLAGPRPARGHRRRPGLAGLRDRLPLRHRLRLRRPGPPVVRLRDGRRRRPHQRRRPQLRHLQRRPDHRPGRRRPDDRRARRRRLGHRLGDPDQRRCRTAR